MDKLANQQAAEPIDSVYQDLESQLMQNIIRHLRDWKQPIDSDRWLLKKLAEIGKLNKENLAIIAQASGLAVETAMQMLEAAADEAITEMEPAMKHVPRQALAGEVVEASKSRNVSQVMTNLQKQAKDTLNLCNTNMLYKARDAYQKVANTMASAFKEIENKQEYISTLGNYAAAVTQGMESRQQAVRKCIQEFNNKGIPAFVDKRGREWTPEAYVNMAMRNTVKNTADEVQTARCRDYGVNLVAIDSHSGARPKCAKDQGKIYDLDNGSGYVEDLNGKKIQYYPWNSTSYGEPDGLLGINCGHHKYPFWPGLSLQRYFPVEDLEASDKLYQKTQVQRALERDVRKSKRECMLLDEAGDKEGFEAAAIRLKAKEAKLTAYVNADPELHRRKDREQVVGFDKSISAKAKGSAQKHYAEWAKSIGASSKNGGPKTLAGYYDLKYNNGKENRLYKGYVTAVKKGNISPLVGYDKFLEVANKAESQFIGMTTSDGELIQGITAHFVDRVIGQQSANSPSRKGVRNGVELADIEDALKNPLNISPVIEKENGKRSKLYYGANASVSYNPDTKELIQVQPRRAR